MHFVLYLNVEHLFCLQQSPDSSFTGAGAAVEEELQELKTKLREVEANSRGLQERLQTTEQLLQEKESVHAEQVTPLLPSLINDFNIHKRKALSKLLVFCSQLLKLQAVICEKDVRFQEQIQKHEEELLRVTTQSQDDGALQQV